jgi:hypothetical protein
VFDPDDPGPDYELAWPRELFASEARAVSSGPHEVQAEVELLLEEAFTNDVPKHDYRNSGGGFDLVVGPSDPVPQQSLLRQLLAAAGRLPTQARPSPYYSQRRGSAVHVRAIGPGRARQLQTDWADIVNDLQSRGYLDRLAPRRCVDDPGPAIAPDHVISGEIERRTGIAEAWPPRPWVGDGWSEDEFYDLIEVVHDLLARPRSRRLHDYNGCGWHYSNFAAAPARELYRARVNALLARYNVDLRLAEAGEDAGRLVHIPGDDRVELLTRAMDAATGEDRDIVAHAIARFRSRSATREDKRSACIALAGLLEQRRDLVKTELLSKDEGALFQIANQFMIRHRNADQRGDYDEAYLDWLFWIYLATVELTDRLAARETS